MKYKIWLTAGGNNGGSGIEVETTADGDDREELKAIVKRECDAVSVTAELVGVEFLNPETNKWRNADQLVLELKPAGYMHGTWE